MDSGNVLAGEANMMSNASQQGRMQNSTEGISMATISASILILTGVVFQLAELGSAHLHGDDLWFFSVLAGNIWNMLALRFNAPAMQEMRQIWPLALVGVGLAMLLATQQTRQRAVARKRAGVRYGE